MKHLTTKFLSLIMFVITTMIVASCSKEDTTYEVPMDCLVRIKILDKNDQNLLNPNTPGAIDVNKIKILYDYNGKACSVEEIMPDVILDNPKMFKVIDDSQIEVPLNMFYADADNKAITYIQWHENDVDTVISTCVNTNHSDIYYNGKYILKSAGTAEAVTINK